MLDYAKAGDFRDQAVEESRRLLDAAGKADPLELGASCVVRLEGFEGAVRQCRWLAVGTLVLAVSWFALAGLFIWAPWPMETLPRAGTGGMLAGACVAAGLATMIGANIIGRLPARRVILRRLGLSRGELRDGYWIGLEDSRTYNRLKVIPDDIGMLFLHPQLACIQIEGLTHQYVIYARDVDDLRAVQSGGGAGTQVTFRVGGAGLLAVTLISQGIRDETRRQTTGGNVMYERVRTALFPVLPDAGWNPGTNARSRL